MTEQIEINTKEAALHGLSYRCKNTEEFLESMLKGDRLMIPPEQVLNLVVQMILNQMAMMRTLETLLVEKPHENM